ncbi:MAG: hypothetical protein WA421_14615, partial [Nitrososphaeraceae archaeon]
LDQVRLSSDSGIDPLVLRFNNTSSIKKQFDLVFMVALFKPAAFVATASISNIRRGRINL